MEDSKVEEEGEEEEEEEEEKEGGGGGGGFTQQCFRVGNGVSGRDFGRTATEKTSTSVLRRPFAVLRLRNPGGWPWGPPGGPGVPGAGFKKPKSHTTCGALSNGPRIVEPQDLPGAGWRPAMKGTPSAPASKFIYTYIYIYLYFRLLNIASGPELVACWGLHGPLLPQNPLEKVGGQAPHLSRGLCGR